MSKLNFNTVAALGFIVLAVVLFFLIPYQIDKPLFRLAGSENELSPEQFPRMGAVAFFILGVWYAVKSFSLTQKNELRELDREAIVNVTVTLIAMAVYVV
ncbi:MAG: hypothetical protein HQ503_00395, partial [Rhodospirillales bacterium]|nr:hypothetical protein [Rhodospirillales bacterium]